MQYPYFTNSDPALIRSGGGRDPLSLLPVWSSYGRNLVPNLASPVTQVNGIIAVLFIHWLYEKPLEKFFSDGDKSFRQYFRIMEGLLEYFLWNASPSHDGYCFGTRALSAEGEGFRVTAADVRTAVNGLYQYYRGTCRRANLLDGDWSVPAEVSNSFSGCWDEKATNILVNILTPPLANSKVAISPSAIFNQNPNFDGCVKAVFHSQQIRALLQQQLLGEARHVAFAGKCAILNAQKVDYTKEGWSNWCLGQLKNWMQEDDCPAKDLLNHVVQAQKCEPFLLLMQDCFDFMLASPGEKLPGISAKLQVYASHIRQRASGFLALTSSNHADRMLQMLSLAEIAQSDISLFLISILNHHHKCMMERGRDPMVFMDEDKIIVPSPSDRDGNSILKRLESGLPWINGYYLWNAGEIYRQLYGVQNG